MIVINCLYLPGTVLKGLSHDHFGVVFLIPMDRDLDLDLYWLLNFLRAPLILYAIFLFVMRFRAEVLDTLGISNIDQQSLEFCD